MGTLLNNLMTLEELCSDLKVKPQWVYRQTRERAIPFTKIGKYLRFYRPEIERWLAQNSYKPVADR